MSWKAVGATLKDRIFILTKELIVDKDTVVTYLDHFPLVALLKQGLPFLQKDCFSCPFSGDRSGFIIRGDDREPLLARIVFTSRVLRSLTRIGLGLGC